MKLTDIPGLAEAITARRFLRTACFVPVPETIGGLAVLPFTLLHRDTLEIIGSPFIVGGPIFATDVGAFLWIISPQFRPPPARWARRRFLQRVARIRYPRPIGPLPPDFNPAQYTISKICGEISDYLDEAFTDLGGASASGPASRRVTSSPWSTTAALVDTFAAEYGWTADTIRNQPVKVLLQLRNLIQHRNGGIVFDGTEEIKQRWLDQPATRTN